MDEPEGAFSVLRAFKRAFPAFCTPNKRGRTPLPAAEYLGVKGGIILC